MTVQQMRQEQTTTFSNAASSSPSLLDKSTEKHRNKRKMAALAHDKSRDAAAVASFFSSFSSLRCTACRCSCTISQRDVERFTAQDGGEFHLTCLACGAVTCLGCGTLITAETAMLSNSTIDGRPLRWHCDQGRTILLWAVLCGYDADVKPTPLPSEQHPEERPTKRVKRDTRGGIGYSADEDFDEQYAELPDVFDDETAIPGFDLPDAVHSTEPPERSQSLSPPVTKPGPIDNNDGSITKAVSAVAALLPTPGEAPRTARYDHNPPRVVKSLLLRSSILDKVAELLRNNSLEDVSRRFPLYNAINALACVLAQSALTLEVISQPRRINKLGHDLMKVSLQSQTRLSSESEESSAPLVDSLNEIADQCTSIERSATMHPDEFDDDESQKLLLLCRNIKATKKGVLESCGGQTTDCIANDVPKDETAWQKDLVVVELPDDQIRTLHSYDGEATKITTQTSAPGRMRRILQELASLKANLPPNIFVRYAESRPDQMKVLIVGPQGTPYAHGLFEFDLLCPSDYPQSPPKMTFRTTGRGRVHFNPNLYSSGYVCLSLLGTWQGEPWDPRKSTIMQVLVSIQAMVLCDEPYCNEPGRHGLRGTTKSKAYDRSLYAHVVRFAMLEWIDGKVSEGCANVPPPSTFDEDYADAGFPDYDTPLSQSPNALVYEYYAPANATKPKNMAMSNADPYGSGPVPPTKKTDSVSKGEQDAASPWSLDALPTKQTTFCPYPIPLTHHQWMAPPTQNKASTAQNAIPLSLKPHLALLSEPIATYSSTKPGYAVPHTGNDDTSAQLPPVGMTIPPSSVQEAWDSMRRAIPPPLFGTEMGDWIVKMESMLAKAEVDFASYPSIREHVVALRNIVEQEKQRQSTSTNKTDASKDVSTTAQKASKPFQDAKPTNWYEATMAAAAKGSSALKNISLVHQKKKEADSSSAQQAQELANLSPDNLMQSSEQLLTGPSNYSGPLADDPLGLQMPGTATNDYLTAAPKTSIFGYAGSAAAPSSGYQTSVSNVVGAAKNAPQNPYPYFLELPKMPAPFAPGTALPSVFDDVVTLHFQHNRDQILETVQRWVKEVQEHKRAPKPRKRRETQAPASMPSDNKQKPKKSKKQVPPPPTKALAGEELGGTGREELDALAPLRDHLTRALESLQVPEFVLF